MVVGLLLDHRFKAMIQGLINTAKNTILSPWPKQQTAMTEAEHLSLAIATVTKMRKL